MMSKHPMRRAMTSTSHQQASLSALMVVLLILATTVGLQHEVHASPHSFDSSAARRHRVGGWRGGVAAALNNDDNVGVSTISENDSQLVSQSDTPQPQQRRKHKFWSIASLFELNSEAQEGALEQEQEMEPLPPGNGRGGALAMMVKKKPPPRRGFFQLGRPALVPDEPEEQQQNISNNDAASNLVESGSPMRRFLQLKEEAAPEPKASAEVSDMVDEKEEEDEETALAAAAVAEEEEPEVTEESSSDDETIHADIESSEEEESTQLNEEVFFEELKAETPSTDAGVMGLWWNNAWSTSIPDDSGDDPVKGELSSSESVAAEEPVLTEKQEDEEALTTVENPEEEEEEEQPAEVEIDKQMEQEQSAESIDEAQPTTAVTEPELVSTVSDEECEPPTLEVKKKKKKSEEVNAVEDVLAEVAPVEEAPEPVAAPKKKKKKKKAKQQTVIEEPVIEESLALEELAAIVAEELEDKSLDEDLDLGPAIVIGESPYMSSGAWEAIDKIVSLGLAANNPSLRLSRHTRSMRKVTAKVTGLHGLLSGKQKNLLGAQPDEEETTLDEEDLGQIRRRIAAIDRARKSVELKQEEDAVTGDGKRFFRRRRKERIAAKKALEQLAEEQAKKAAGVAPEITVEIIKQDEIDQDEEGIAEQRRKERVKEIDRQMSQGQERLHELACEKDALQQRPNPLYNYTTTPIRDGDNYKFSREFNFPPDSLVEDYLDDLFANGRLVRMNHTELWKSGFGFDDDEDEHIGDDLLTPSADASRLYQEDKRKVHPTSGEKRQHTGNGGGGSWLLRQSIGKGGSLGEKIGEAAECSGYRAVCAAVMSSLARSISAIHGINVMTHSDIRLFVEQAPDLPPIGRNSLPQNHYAQEAIRGAMMKGRSKRKKKARLSEEAFIQRDAVVETLLSHCQISAPLLKLFPLAWQRELLANMVTLITHVVSDFCDGIELQILGHSLTFSFKPITESDMIRHIGLAGKGLNHRRARPEEFEAALRATAEDVSHSLKFLDRWHERALGSGMLRAQIANLIARIVLTLADEVLSGARMDLWAAQAGGPRVVAGLEYRTTPSPTPEDGE